MSTRREQAVAERMALVLELNDLADRMSLARLQRKHPDASPAELSNLLSAARRVVAPPALPGTVVATGRFGEGT